MSEITTRTHCTVANVRQALTTALEPPQRGDDRIAAAAAEAAELGFQAYERGSTDALALAERLLYVIHVGNSFAAPMQAVPGVIWGALARAKLGAALRAADVPAELDAAEMNRRLESAIAEHDASQHPIAERLSADPDGRGLRVFAKNWFTTAHGFTAQLIALAQRCRGSLRDSVLHNLADEFDGIDHELLRRRFAESVGAVYDPEKAPSDPEHLTAAFGVLNFRTTVNSLNDPCYALGSFYSVEAATPPMCKRLVGALRARGLAEEAIRTFTLHVDADEDHAGEWLAEINKAPLNGAERARVVAGAYGQLAARRAWFQSMAALLYPT